MSAIHVLFLVFWGLLGSHSFSSCCWYFWGWTSPVCMSLLELSLRFYFKSLGALMGRPETISGTRQLPGSLHRVSVRICAVFSECMAGLTQTCVCICIDIYIYICIHTCRERCHVYSYMFFILKFIIIYIYIYIYIFIDMCIFIELPFRNA